jgi:hypothetical protein
VGDVICVLFQFRVFAGSGSWGSQGQILIYHFQINHAFHIQLQIRLVIGLTHLDFDVVNYSLQLSDVVQRREISCKVYVLTWSLLE